MKTKYIIWIFLFTFFQTIHLFGEEGTQMINYVDFGYICISVDDIEQASEFYKKVFQAKLIDSIPHLKNIGYAKCAGFLDEPETLDMSIRYLSISNLFIELQQIHAPKETVKNQESEKNIIKVDISKPVIVLRIKNIEKAFNHIKNQDGIKLANESDDYKPFQLSKVTSDQIHFYDEDLDKNKEKKEEAAKRISNIKYFMLCDKYGIQWSFVENN